MKRIFRVKLKSAEWNFINDIAIAACLANGGTPMNLLALEAYANVKVKLMGLKDVSVSISDYDLLIDKGNENLLHITEIEADELDMPQLTNQEAKDLLDELAPTLHRQSGIANPSNHENLN